MRIDLFDAQAAILTDTPGVREEVTAGELLASMKRFDISRALVRTEPTASELDVPRTNARLYEACADHPELAPCPAVIPNTAGDLADEQQQIAEAIDHGAGSVCIRPAHDHWLIADWLSDRLFEAMTARCMPVYVAAPAVGFAEVADLASRYEELPILLAEVGYRDQRILVPLLERFGNIHLITGWNYRVQGGIEQLARRAGADQVLFGGGFPNGEPMTSITQLTYADLPEGDLRKIGSGNFERLMEGIRR